MLDHPYIITIVILSANFDFNAISGMFKYSKSSSLFSWWKSPLKKYFFGHIYVCDNVLSSRQLFRQSSKADKRDLIKFDFRISFLKLILQI